MAVFAATGAHATTFTVDAANSSVSLTETGSGFICSLTNCGVDVSLASGLSGTSFDLDNPGDVETFDFLTFGGRGVGLNTYDIEATLAFSSPILSITSGGSGGVLVFGGSIAAGLLEWDDVPATVFLSDGSEITVDFEGGFDVFLGHSVTTTASLTLESVSPSAVPLPASGLLLLGGFGGLALLRRRRRAASV
ncbi:MAG: VPLPA-CTERM sorting domain-containing protein [Pseudomonadota bacterium]